MFVDVLFLIAGIYLLVMTLKMKKTGEISSQLIGKKTDLSKAKDIEGYINKIYPHNLVFSGILIVTSLIGLLRNFVILPVAVNIIVFVAYIAGIIYYSCISVKYQKTYLA